jgi:ABC-type lipoprotein release transport system permease subunit
MLFDLRSRRRRTFVRIIYVMLAVVMVSGLILVGVGTGGSNNGLLNAFTNNGSGGTGSQNAAINKQTEQALKATKQNPNSMAAWRKLVVARWSAAGVSPGNFNSATSTYTASGKKQLKLALTAWDK